MSEKQTTLHIEGMSCTSCAASVEKALKTLEFVGDAQVSFAGKKAVVRYRDEEQEEDIRDRFAKVIKDAGYSLLDPVKRREE